MQIIKVLLLFQHYTENKVSYFSLPVSSKLKSILDLNLQPINYLVGFN